LRTKGDRIMKAALGLMLAMIGGVVIGASRPLNFSSADRPERI
jgi:hypothetical protein